MPKDDLTWLNIGYVAFAVLIGFVTYQAFELIGIQTSWDSKYEWFNWTKNIASVVIGAGSTVLLRTDKERHEYFLSAVSEIRKVTWPSFDDTRKMTVVVCVVVAIFAVILALFDILWAKVLGLILA